MLCSNHYISLKNHCSIHNLQAQLSLIFIVMMVKVSAFPSFNQPMQPSLTQENINIAAKESIRVTSLTGDHQWITEAVWENSHPHWACGNCHDTSWSEYTSDYRTAGLSLWEGYWSGCLTTSTYPQVRKVNSPLYSHNLFRHWHRSALRSELLSTLNGLNFCVFRGWHAKMIAYWLLKTRESHWRIDSQINISQIISS